MKLHLIVGLGLGLALASAPAPAATPSKKSAKADQRKQAAPQKKARSKSKPPPSFAKQLVKRRPKGWRVLRTPPPELAAVLVSRARPEGRSVVSLRPWTPPLPLPTREEGWIALGERLGLKAPFERIDLGDSLGTQFQTGVQNGVQVRYILHPRGLVSIAATPQRLPAVYAWVMKALGRLR